jgi:lipid-binding SYLF domain-containing protein
MKSLRTRTLFLIFLVALTALGSLRPALAVQSREQEAKAALNALYETSPAARALGARARAILVFPEIRKGGFILGGQFGHGVLLKNDKVVARYDVDGVLFGVEAGAQTFAYAVFFMSDAALEEMRAAHGLSIGADPNIVIVDAGSAKELTTGTASADVYAYVFKQKGLMGGVALQGLKFTEIQR